MRNMQFFNENMLGKVLEFDHMHETKYFFLFLKREINLKVFEIFFFKCFEFFLKYFEKNQVF